MVEASQDRMLGIGLGDYTLWSSQLHYMAIVGIFLVVYCSLHAYID